MKTMMTIAALMLGTTAFAGEPINDPRAEIFRANGCDAEWLKPVIGKDGETVLYWTNTKGKGCTGGIEPTDWASRPFPLDPVEDDHEVEPEEELASK